MKKLITIIIVLCVTFTFSQKVKFGFKAMVGRSKSSQIPGYLIGAFTQIKLNETFEFETGINYNRQNLLGYKFFNQSATNFNRIDTFNNDYYLNYIQVPLQLNLYVFKKFSLNFGPQLNFMLSGTSENIYTVATFSYINNANVYFNSEQKTEGDAKDVIKSFNLGYNIGGNIEFYKGFGLKIEFHSAFGNIFKDNELNINEAPKTYHAGFFYKY